MTLLKVGGYNVPKQRKVEELRAKFTKGSKSAAFAWLTNQG